MRQKANGKEDIEKLEQFYIELQKDTNANYFSWYYLAKIFSIANKKSKVKECIKKASDFLIVKEENISDVAHKESFKKQPVTTPGDSSLASPNEYVIYITFYLSSFITSNNPSFQSIFLRKF